MLVSVYNSIATKDFTFFVMSQHNEERRHIRDLQNMRGHFLRNDFNTASTYRKEREHRKTIFWVLSQFCTNDFHQIFKTVVPQTFS